MERKPKVWPQTQWRMFECDHGARWTTVLDHDVDGAICDFSGCSQDHHIHQVGITVNRDIASAWFRRP